MGPAGHDSVEWIAALILVIGGAIAIAFAFRARSSPSGPAAAPIGLVLVLTSLAPLAIATGPDHDEPGIVTMPAMDHVATE